MIFERSEYNLYKIENILSEMNVECEFVFGDLCDRDNVEYVVHKFKPDFISILVILSEL